MKQPKKISDKQDEENLIKKPEHYFMCCDNKFEPKEFYKHLLEAHNIDVKSKPAGTKKMTMHMDGSYWFSSSYEWELGGIKFGEYVRMARAKDDMMRFA